MHFVSVIAPIYNERKFIAAFLDSILQQDYPKDQMEILLADGMSNDGTRDIIQDYVKKYKSLGDTGLIRLIDNADRAVSFGFNAAVRACKGDVVVRMDAHCKYPTNYISRLTEELFRLNAENTGGLIRTLSADDSTKCLAIAAAVTHPLGVGNSTFRIGARKIKEVDTVPFGCFRRSIFDRIGYLDVELIRNQDDEFNGRIIKNGGKIFIIPDIIVDYTMRDSFKKMRQMYYQYGLYKPLVNKKLGHAATVRQFFPSLFVLGLIFGTILSFVAPFFKWLFLSVLALYLLMAFGVGVQYVFRRNNRWLMAVLMPWAIINLHLSYGIGYLKGLWNVAFNKKTKVNYNR